MQFGGLSRLDAATNNYKDNMNALYCHADMTVSLEWALRNIIVCAYTHYIDTWTMNGACMGHHAILMHSMLTFAMHRGRYRHQEKHYIKEYKRKRIPLSTPIPPINIPALLHDAKENLKLEQIKGTHPGVMDLLGDPGSPLYAEQLSMTEFFDVMIVGAHHIGDMPKRGHCKDFQTATHVYKDEKHQVIQKIFGCLDMRVIDRNLVMLTCLHMPTLILPHKHFAELYFDPDNQGRYASKFQSGGGGFLQLWGDILSSIVPKNFRTLPTNIRQVIDSYFNREELEAYALVGLTNGDQDGDQEMSTNTEAAWTVD